MQRRKIFGVEKFKALLLAGSFTVLASYVVRLSDSIIAGRLLGENAFAGVNLVGPCLSIVSFLAGLIATGMATNYSLALGRCDRLRARGFFMQGVWSVLIFGGLLGLVLLFGREQFLAFFGASSDVTAYARDYLRWIWPMSVLEGLVMLLVSLGYADGDARTCSLGYVAIFVGNFLFSVLLVKCGLGTSGCAIGSLVAELTGLLVLATHFLRKSNSFAPVWHFAWKDTVRIVSASFGDAAAFLCNGLLFLFLNKFVIMNFGSGVLPVVGVANALWGFLALFDGLGVAIQPIVTVYYGEGNTVSARQVMNAAMRWGVYEGTVFMVAFGCFPELALGIVGIEDPTLVPASVTAIRCMSVGFVALAFAGLFNSYYMFVERAGLAACVTFLAYLIMPICCCACGAFYGIEGVWAGLGLGPFLGVALTGLIVLSSSGSRMFPLLLPRERESALHVFNLTLTEAEIVDVSRRIAAVPGVPMKVSLLVEEVFMVVRDRAPGRRLLGEAILDLNDGVKLTLRDDGEIFDITDADQRVSSLRSYLVASMMCCHEGRMNLVTTGFNRNVFKF